MSDNDSTTPEAPALPTPSNLRRFALDTGIVVGTRGTIPASVRDAFLKAGKRVQKKYL